MVSSRGELLRVSYCGDGSCCGVAGESGAMANWRARPRADSRMKATSAAAIAASSCQFEKH